MTQDTRDKVGFHLIVTVFTAVFCLGYLAIAKWLGGNMWLNMFANLVWSGSILGVIVGAFVAQERARKEAKQDGTKQ